MKHRFLYILVLMLAVATGGRAQSIDLTSNDSRTVWTLDEMLDDDVELVVEYYTDEELAVELTKTAKGEWTLDDPHQLFSGAVVTGGEGIARVGRVGDATVFGALASELQTETRTSPLKLRLSRLARQISRIGYFSAGVIALSYLFRAIVVGGGFSLAGIGALLSDPSFLLSTLIRALTLSITVIVVAVPEGLPMMITVVLSSNMRRMMRDHVLVKKLVGR